MPRFWKIAIVVLLVPISLALMVGIVFAVDRATNGGEVLGRVVALDVEIGGLDEAAALAELQALEQRYLDTPLTVEVAGREFSLDPAEVGFDLDEESMLSVALDHGRSGTIPDQFRWWIGHFDDEEVVLDLPYTYDDLALAHAVARWEISGLDEPPYPGGIAMVDGAPVIDPPRPGTGIDRAEAAALIGPALIDLDREPISLRTRTLEPPVDVADLEAVAAEAEDLISESVTLIDETTPLATRVIVPRSVLAEALTIRPGAQTSPPSYNLVWDEEPIVEYVAEFADRLETEPIDAELIVDDEIQTVTVTPSAPVYRPDLDSLVREVRLAVRRDDRTGPLPFVEGEQPEVTTEEIEALGVKELIGEFTTYHNCCENRVINIQLIADAVDGAMVMPGETWSLNEHVGQRTTAKGYVPAGAIIRGELYCCDDPINIGGGTSQFTTTLYNAIFFAGLEDVEHMPHTIYFTRYPEGREATLGYPKPDLVFRNNTDAAVIIRTSHTDTSITARIYGDNGGIHVEAGLSNRYNFSGIRETIDYTTDVAPGEERIRSQGSGGWSVDIFRYITYPDGTETTEEWTWHYTGAFRVIERHPCSRTNSCPTDDE